MLTNYDVVVFSPIYDQFSVIQKPDSRCLFCKIYIFLKNNPWSSKSFCVFNRSKRSLTQLSYYLFELRTIFVKKGWNFTKKCCIPKMKGVLVLRGIYSGTKYVCINLSFKTQVSSMIITRFRQGNGVILLPLLPQPQIEPRKILP